MTDEKATLDEKLRDNRALIAEVQRLTVERDRARDIAVALEQQTAEALRIARGCFFPQRDARPSMLVNRASIVELLHVLETENQ